jgi:hypothetical protein
MLIGITLMFASSAPQFDFCVNKLIFIVFSAAAYQNYASNLSMLLLLANMRYTWNSQSMVKLDNDTGITMSPVVQNEVD